MYYLNWDSINAHYLDIKQFTNKQNRISYSYVPFLNNFAPTKLTFYLTTTFSMSSVTWQHLAKML